MGYNWIVVFLLRELPNIFCFIFDLDALVFYWYMNFKVRDVCLVVLCACRLIYIEFYQWVFLSTTFPLDLALRNLMSTFWLVVTSQGKLLSMIYLHVEHFLFDSVFTNIFWIWPWLRYQASKDDITVYSALSKPPPCEFVNVSRWYKHIDALLRIS